MQPCGREVAECDRVAVPHVDRLRHLGLQRHSKLDQLLVVPGGGQRGSRRWLRRGAASVCGRSAPSLPLALCHALPLKVARHRRGAEVRQRGGELDAAHPVSTQSLDDASTRVENQVDHPRLQLRLEALQRGADHAGGLLDDCNNVVRLGRASHVARAVRLLLPQRLAVAERHRLPQRVHVARLIHLKAGR